MGDVEIVVKVKVPEGLDEESIKAIRKQIAVDAVKEIEKRLKKAERFGQILQRSKMSKEDAEKLADEIGRAVAEHYGVL